MNSSALEVNGKLIDRNELLFLLQNNKKLLAVKQLREQAKIGLKDALEIVEMLEIDPLFKPNDQLFQSANSDFNVTKSTKKKGNHIISNGTAKSKSVVYIALGCAVIIAIYFMMQN